MICPNCQSPISPTTNSCDSCGYIVPANFTGAPAATATVAFNPQNTSSNKAPLKCDCCNNMSSPNALFCSYCQIVLPLPVGTVVGNRWTINSGLKPGGMGRVYVASDRNTRTEVVIKELLEEQGRPQDARQTYLSHFQNEAQVLESLKMVRSVPKLIKGVTQDGPRHYFVMEYIDGDDLSEIVSQKGSLDPRKVVEYGISVCDALEIIHARNPPIVHRDIKPDNLKIRKSDGSLALLDFGIARNVRDGTNITKGVGTKGYVSPEQKDGLAEPRSDLYSLASTMYFLLSGIVPDDPMSRMPGALRGMNSKVDVELENIILANLNENPNERYNTAAEFSLDLKRGKMTQTIICPNKTCLTPNDRRMIYCTKCATPLINKSRQCGRCSSFIPFRVKFCPTCGNQV